MTVLHLFISHPVQMSTRLVTHADVHTNSLTHPPDTHPTDTETQTHTHQTHTPQTQKHKHTPIRTNTHTLTPTHPFRRAHTHRYTHSFPLLFQYTSILAKTLGLIYKTYLHTDLILECLCDQIHV